MKKNARALAAAVAAFVVLTGCSDTQAAEEPTAPAPTTPTATSPTPTPETATDPTEDPTQLVDVDGNPVDEEDIGYAFDSPDLNWTETYAFMDLIWQSADQDQQNDICDERYEIGDEATYDEFQSIAGELEGDATPLGLPSGAVLDRYGVYDYLEEACI